MQTLEASLSELVLNGIVTYEDAVARSLSPKEIARPRGVQAADVAPA
jgi:twitching motility protein PilT